MTREQRVYNARTAAKELRSIGKKTRCGNYDAWAKAVEETIEENRRLREAMKWALETIADEAVGEPDSNGIPNHLCDYTFAPLTGYCKFHDMYQTAHELAHGKALED